MSAAWAVDFRKRKDVRSSMTDWGISTTDMVGLSFAYLKRGYCWGIVWTGIVNEFEVFED